MMTPLKTLGLTFCLQLASAGTATAAVSQSAADAFVIESRVTVPATPLQAWLALVQPSRWWDPAHTWSGDAANLRLDPRAGGCFCESWKGNSVEHLRVVWFAPPTELRMTGGLGPLQAMGLDGILTFSIKPEASGSEIGLSYRVSGDSLHALAELAPAVDKVLAGQLERLQRLLLERGVQATGD